MRYVHGMHNSPEYKVWSAMKRRCRNKKCHAYKHYGEIGIDVEESWYSSFLNFINDIGRRPSSRHTLERINNNLGYSKENCKWATWAEQHINKKGKLKKKVDLPAGVYRADSKKGIRAQIKIEGINYHLGSFSSVVEANEAYKKIFKEWYGRDSVC